MIRSIKSSIQVLLGPYSYLLQVAGKEIRSQLSNAFNAWLKIPDDKLKIIIDITQMLHNASLLIDDIEDNSNLRRGIPVAHHIYGIPQTINTANYVYFLGLQKAISLDHPEVTKVFTEQLLELHRGQGMDIYWRDTNNCPTEDEYIKMVKRKTGGLFGLAVKLMQLFSSNKSDFKPLCDNLGLYFQIRDDYANLKSTELTSNKGYAEDLTEGKFSFPIIHGIRSHPENDQLMNILLYKSHQIHVKKYCIDYLESVGSFQYTKRKLEDLENEYTKNLGGNEILEQTIKKLSIVYKES
ncbi:hypothetical protein HELRODRAFT_157766 [Helobdella robusta]|uniref:Geranylgeranyl diphosphate synthase 1 n=1 Tax=Helobdella robusta TaxID=6412 RepID=T1EMF5_HELRO|nr:hypothetical protein HELRODRAFT_157766 [Helobdella robusta]ESN94089.1 hypothetical protein HELRODRAFT_157766 [Helobdella robusta]